MPYSMLMSMRHLVMKTTRGPERKTLLLIIWRGDVPQKNIYQEASMKRSTLKGAPV